MTRTLSKASGLFEFIEFCLSGMLAVVMDVTLAPAIFKPEKNLVFFSG